MSEYSSMDLAKLWRFFLYNNLSLDDLSFESVFFIYLEFLDTLNTL